MTAPLPRPRAVAPLVRRRRFWFLTTIPFLVAASCWWLTEPLRETGEASTAAIPAPVPSSRSDVLPIPPPAPAVLQWPVASLAGDAAKRLLLEVLLRAEARLDRLTGYTATFRKQERIRGRLGPEQTLAMKVRHRPFAIYLKFLAPKAGKEVVYAEGRYENCVIAHNGDWTRRLIPRLRVAPTDPVALADNRHPITEAGLANLTAKLIGFRRMDLTDRDAVTILDRTTDDEGRPWLRSLHTHPHRTPERPFARVEVLYELETWLPLRITCFDWPEPGRTGDLNLAERYAYDDLVPDPPLADIDFDPANPAYAFTRF